MKPEKQIGKGGTGRLFTADAMRPQDGHPACESAKERAHGRRRLSGLGGRRWLWVASAVLFSVLLCSLLGWIDPGAAQHSAPGGLVSGIAALGWTVGRWGR